MLCEVKRAGDVPIGGISTGRGALSEAGVILPSVPMTNKFWCLDEDRQPWVSLSRNRVR